jgi:hypothetical protein
MSQDSSEVPIVESVNIRGKRVGEAILEYDSGLTLANSSRIDCEGPQEITFYSLLLGKPLPRKWGIFRRRRQHIADLNTSPDKDKKWLMTIRGRAYCDRLQKLAKFLQDKFAVQIHVRLDSESPGEELFDSDD